MKNQIEANMNKVVSLISSVVATEPKLAMAA